MNIPNLITIIRIPETRLKLCYLFIELSIVLGYSIHWYNDWGAEKRGGHPRVWFRRLSSWKYIADYFPIRMVLSRTVRNTKECPDVLRRKTTESNLNENQRSDEQNFFDSKQNYLLGYHPHGIISLGSFINFLTEANNFSERFPGMTPWVVTLEMNFKPPIQRDILMSLNAVSANYQSISHVLTPEKCGRTGNAVMVVLGGADEALDSRPSNYVFHMSKRYGLFKLAFTTGSHLVPCISFGEPNMYKQVWNPKGSFLRWLQEKLANRMAYSCPLIYARGLFPYKTPVTTVIGDPILVEKKEKPTREEVAALKERYCKALADLYEEFRPIYDPIAKDLVFV